MGCWPGLIKADTPQHLNSTVWTGYLGEGPDTAWNLE